MTIRERASLSLFGHAKAKLQSIAMVYLSAFICAYPVYSIGWAILDRRQPVDYIEAYALHPNVTPGGQTEIRFDVDRKRICEIINISRAIVDKDGLEHVVNGYTRTNGTRPGREVYDRTITIPETVPPGKAWYYIRLRYGCNFLNFWGWPIVVESPRVPLTVWPKVDKGLGLPAKVEAEPASYDG